MILGFGVNIITFLVIKYTNAVTLKVIGVARSVGLVWFGIMTQGDVVNSRQLVGYGLSIVFFFVYSYLKTKKM